MVSRRPLTAWGAVAPLLLALSACQGTTPSGSAADPGGQRAVSASLPYSVTAESGAPVIRRESTAVVIEADLGVFRGLRRLAPMADGRFALLGEGGFAVVDAEGRAVTAEAPGCEGVAATPSRVLLLCGGAQLGGRAYTIRLFDPQARAQGEFELSKIFERVGPEPIERYDEAPQIVAVGDAVVWIAYPDREGFARGGSRLVAKHDLTGRLLASVRVDGAIYDSAPSPGGRYLALLAGGSGGACHTQSNLRVVDLDSMRSVNTAPDTPLAALAEAQDGYDVYFTGAGLRWASPTVVEALGTTAHHSAAECDAGLQTWRRVLDVQEPGVADEPVAHVDPDTSGWVGPACDDVLFADDQGLVLRTGGRETVLPDAQLLYAAEPPERCQP